MHISAMAVEAWGRRGDGVWSLSVYEVPMKVKETEKNSLATEKANKTVSAQVC